MTVAQDVINVAKTELGYTESPYGSNRTKFAAEAGHANGYAWCATFAVAMFRRVKIKLGNESAYTPSLYSSLKAEGRAISGPRAGAVGFLYFPSLGRIAHVVIVVAVLPDGRFITIEGNTDVAGGRTGGRVLSKVRSTSNFYFAMPNYEKAPTPKPPTPKPGVPAPPFPLPRGYYFGPRTGPKESVSGYYSYGANLAQWQRQMIARGWDLGSSGADGRFGDDTAEVVRAFQMEKHLEVDGQIGPATWAAAWTSPLT